MDNINELKIVHNKQNDKLVIKFQIQKHVLTHPYFVLFVLFCSLGMVSTSVILSDVCVTVDFSGTTFFLLGHFFLLCHPLLEKCPYSQLFWSAFSRIWTEYGEIFRISLYSVQMWENVDQHNSEYGHFLGSDPLIYFLSHEEVSTGQFNLFQKSPLKISYILNERLYVIQNIMGNTLTLHKKWSFPLRISLFVQC